MTNANNKNALDGRNVETLFKESLGSQLAIINNLCKAYEIYGKFEAVTLGGIYGGKADARISFKCGHHIEANIKSFKGGGFNQITRTSVSNFCHEFDLSTSDKKELENLVTAKARNKNQDLFPEQTRDKWRTFFVKNASNLLRWGFADKPNREILVLYSRDDSVMYLYRMKDVLKFLPKKITFTKGGFNIGSCISFQRKGGDGNFKKLPKTDIGHPGNDIQLKIKGRKFIAEMSNILLGSYKV
jgi:hypothetical protein